MAQPPDIILGRCHVHTLSITHLQIAILPEGFVYIVLVHSVILEQLVRGGRVMGSEQTVGDIDVPQGGQRVRTARMEAQEVLDIVLLPVVLHHERRRGHYRGCLAGYSSAGDRVFPHATIVVPGDAERLWRTADSRGERKFF